MTGSELRAALARLGMAHLEAARRLGVSYSTIKRWLTDQAPVPQSVVLLLAAWEAHPELARRSA